jgi:response regulator RpfG family c-di-GMP phosphodiesterase
MVASIASHGPNGHAAAVLVVDNESVMRRFVRRTLEAEDFQVEEARDGESALALIQARKEPFDLVLTDLSMPGIDGAAGFGNAGTLSAEHGRALYVGESRRGAAYWSRRHSRPGHGQAIQRRGPISRGA